MSSRNSVTHTKLNYNCVPLLARLGPGLQVLGEVVGWALAGADGLVKKTRNVTCVWPMKNVTKMKPKGSEGCLLLLRTLLLLNIFGALMDPNFCFWIPRFADPKILCPMLPSG